MTGTNIGDELNAAGLSWGWFQGGFRPTTTFAAATGGTQPTSTFIPDQFKGKFATPPASDQGLCNAVTTDRRGIGGTGTNWGWKDDYIPHHEPFEYYASTANPTHLPPSVRGRDRHGHPDLRGRRPPVQHRQPPVRHRDFYALVARSRRLHLTHHLRP